MIAKAAARYVRISPRKVRRVIDLIREKQSQRALAILGAVNKVAAYHVAKVLRSAIDNAKQKPEVKVEDLYISRISADGGPMLKRFRARAMGRATRILKRTCHITVELDTKQIIPEKLKVKSEKLKVRRRKQSWRPKAVSRKPTAVSRKPHAVSRKPKAR